jgi:redox-sensitive bicupin YhaK (pirin superfamily)
MAESVPPHPFDNMEALTWLRSQPDGRVTASAAELGRQWGLEQDADQSPVENVGGGRPDPA